VSTNSLEDYAPLDDALCRAAAARASALVAHAQHDADERVAAARAEADALVLAASREGAVRADLAFARERSIVRRDAAATVLDAKRVSFDELRERCRAAVLELRTAPDYPELLDGLEARARAQLGSAADVTRDPAQGGGIVARAEGQRVDDTLVALADRAVADLAARLDEAWR